MKSNMIPDIESSQSK